MFIYPAYLLNSERLASHTCGTRNWRDCYPRETNRNKLIAVSNNGFCWAEECGSGDNMRVMQVYAELEIETGKYVIGREDWAEMCERNHIDFEFLNWLMIDSNCYARDLAEIMWGITCWFDRASVNRLNEILGNLDIGLSMSKGLFSGRVVKQHGMPITYEQMMWYIAEQKIELWEPHYASRCGQGINHRLCDVV